MNGRKKPKLTGDEIIAIGMLVVGILIVIYVIYKSLGG